MEKLFELKVTRWIFEIRDVMLDEGCCVFETVSIEEVSWVLIVSGSVIFAFGEEILKTVTEDTL